MNRTSSLKSLLNPQSETLINPTVSFYVSSILVISADIKSNKLYIRAGRPWYHRVRHWDEVCTKIMKNWVMSLQTFNVTFSSDSAQIRMHHFAMWKSVVMIYIKYCAVIYADNLHASTIFKNFSTNFQKRDQWFEYQVSS